MTATLMVLVKMLYVEDILGDRPDDEDHEEKKAA